MEKSFSFPANARLKKRKEFVSLNHLGEKKVGQYLVLRILLQDNSSTTRLGITVSKRFGNAAQRNRFKRIVRESFRLIRTDLPQGLQISVRARSAAQKLKMPVIQKELHELLKTHVT